LPSPAGLPSARKRGALVRASHTSGIAVAAVLLGLGFTALNPRFASLTNLGNVVQQIALLGVMATGMTYGLVAGEIDLSVGSNYGVAGMIFALLLQNHAPLALAALAAVAGGAGLGLLNAVLSVGLAVPTIIITLGTLTVYQGLALWLSGGLPISNFSQHGLFWSFARNNLPGPTFIHWIPELAIALLLVAAVGHIGLTRTAFGQRVIATGSSRQAAINAGISVARIRLQTLAIVGITAGIAGVFNVGQFGSANPGDGQTFNLSVIAAVIIGGAALTGGRGNVWASLVGAFIIGEVNNGLILAGTSLYGQTIATGALIVVAVGIDRISHGTNPHLKELRRQYTQLRSNALNPSRKAP